LKDNIALFYCTNASIILFDIG